MDLSKDAFSKTFAALPSQPERPTYRHPDGEHFQVQRMVGTTVVTDSGRWIPATEWQGVKKVG